MSVTPVDKSDVRVKRMFREIAPRYDLMNHVLSMNVDRYWRWRTVGLAAPENDAPILDICTGTGDLAVAYYRRTGGKVPIIGGDFCVEMLEIGNRKKRRLAAGENLTFVEADAQQLRFPDDHFQLVTVAFGLRNVADTDRGLAEMVRVCRPGGRVAVLEFSMPEYQPMKGLYGFYFRHILPRIGQIMARNDQSAYHYLPESVGQFPSGRTLANRLEAAGLMEVSYHPFTLGVATLYLGRKPGAVSETEATGLSTGTIGESNARCDS